MSLNAFLDFISVLGNKSNKQKYHTVGTVPKSNRKNHRKMQNRYS